jgi:putative spermidine/putrescine transport system substrate-binding protein
MIDLISTGQYDGVSASGNASVRLMKRGDVAPVNTDLIPNYADVATGSRTRTTTRWTGRPTASRTAAGPTC